MSLDFDLLNSSWARFGMVVAGAMLIALGTKVIQSVSSRRITDNDRRYRVRKAVTFLGYAATFVLALVVYRGNLNGLSVALGVAGVGVAFALQEVIASIAGWFALTFASFYSPGDRVQLGGIKGDVIDVGLLRTTLMEVGEWVDGDLYTGRLVRVANSFVFKEPVFNYSGEFPFLWDEIVVPVRTGSNWEEARVAIERVLADVVGAYATDASQWWPRFRANFRLEEASLEPTVSMVFNSNFIEFTARYVVDYRRRRATRSELFSRVLRAFEASEGRIVIGSTTVEVIPSASATR